MAKRTSSTRELKDDVGRSLETSGDAQSKRK